MDGEPERRKYYLEDAETSLSQAILEAVEAHESSSLGADELALYESVNPEAIDSLFTDTDDVDISVQINLENVTVSVWSDGGIDVRVSDALD